MTERRTREPSTDDGVEIQRLLEMAGKRPELPAQDLAAIARAARSAWQTQLSMPIGREPSIFRPQFAAPLRRPIVPRLAWGLAAVLVATVGLVGWWVAAGGRASATVAARAEKVSGGTVFEAPSGEGPALRAAASLRAGQAVEVGSRVTTAGSGSTPNDPSGGVALRLAGGASVRLDEGTRIRLVAARRIELAEGAVYVDHAGGGDRSQVEIQTPFGLVREIGTQFSVRRSKAEPVLEVRVREGEVTVLRRDDSASATAGVELLLGAEGPVRRREIAAHGADWEWVLERAPGFAIEGRTLNEFLDWIARETGWKIELSGSASARSAGEIVLHGGTAGLRPDRAAFVVLSSAELTGELVDGTLRITLQEEAGR